MVRKSERMKEAPIPRNEKKRMAALRRINLNKISRSDLDKITSIATNLFNVPISTVTFVDYKKEIHISVCGLNRKEGPRFASFCGHAIAGKKDIMIVPDALKDARFKDNPMVVKGPKIRFYAGVVLKSIDGYNIGTFCIKDRIPRRLNKKQISLLKDMGALVQKEITFSDIMTLEINKDEQSAKSSEDELRRLSSYTRSLIEASLDSLVAINLEGKITDVNQATVNVTGVPRNKLIGSDFSKYFTDPKKASEGYLRVLHETSLIDYPLTIRGKGGKETDVLYNASVYKDTKGRVLGIFAAARDITQQKRVEAAIQKRTDEIERLNKVMVGRELKMVELKQEIKRLTMAQKK